MTRERAGASMERRRLRTGTVERRLQMKRHQGQAGAGRMTVCVLSESGLVGGVGGGVDFAVKFGEVGVCDELVEQCVCGVDGVDGFGCE